MSNFHSLTAKRSLESKTKDSNSCNNNDMCEENDDEDEKDDRSGKRSSFSAAKKQHFAATSVCLASSTFGKSNRHDGQISVKLVNDFDPEDCQRNQHDENENVTLGTSEIKDPVSDCVEKLRRVSKGVLTVWKIIALYLVIILMFGFVYIYTVPSDIREEFNVTVVEKNMDPILLSVSYHKSEQVVLLRCLHPVDFIETLFDLGQDLVAHRNLVTFRCYVRSAISPQFLPEYEELKELIKSNADVTWYRPSETIQMLVLKSKVNAKVLRDVAGLNIAEFCANFKTHWVVSYGRSDKVKLESSTEAPPSLGTTEGGTNASYPIYSKTYTSLIQSSLYMILLRQKVTG